MAFQKGVLMKDGY